MDYKEFMNAILNSVKPENNFSNDKSGSNLSCFSDKQLVEFVSYCAGELSKGIAAPDDLYQAYSIAYDELQKRNVQP